MENKTFLIDLGFALARIEEADDGEPIMTVCWPEAEDSPAKSGTIHSRASLINLASVVAEALDYFDRRKDV